MLHSSMFTVSKVLLLLSVITFVLAAFHVHPGGLELVPLGLAFGFSSFLVP